MGLSDLFSIFVFFLLYEMCATLSSCESRCGSIEVKYPFGTGYGCGSPRFSPSISCSSDNELLLYTHTGSYPVTSISYSTSTLTVAPPLMSNCTFMASSSNFGLDWSGPFQLDGSVFLLLSCSNPSTSLTYKGNPLCDASNSHLCASIYTCPAVLSLGLPLFSDPSSCCVYSPANLGPKGDLDLHGLKCAAFTSVISLGDFPTDPSRWKYGVSLKFTNGGLDSNAFTTACNACEKSNGVCGYTPPKNYFACICKSGINTTSDCYGQSSFWSSNASSNIFSVSRKLVHVFLFYFMIKTEPN